MAAIPGQSSVAAGNLIELLANQAVLRPESRACVWLGDGEGIREALSFGALDEQARAIAARLQGLGAAGECVLLLYPPGLEFPAAFFGCLYAGAIAVPLPLPRQGRAMAQLRGIVADLDARLLLTTGSARSRLERLDGPLLESLVTLDTSDTDVAMARAWRPPNPAADDVAYLQYTSGSTSDRKGVMISHANVLANLAGIAGRFEHHEASVCVNWLPHFHDLGLVSGLLQPLLHGHPNIMMSPTAFVQKPIRWLDAIASFRGTYTNSPNYGYDLCVRKTSAGQRATLDLSSLEVALNGAEPVRRETIDAFAATFAPCGLRAEAMYPAYGLAEATLVVSGGRRAAPPVVLAVSATALEQGRVATAGSGEEARDLVGCGQPIAGTDVAICDPDTGARCAATEVGEILVAGPGVAAGFWQRQADTEADFGARVSGDERRWLRTGDLGFLHEGELFVTGRIKDVIIVRGSNHYPQDIEWTIEQADPAFRPGCGAAFAVDIDGSEAVMAAFELERDALKELDVDALGAIARRAVAEAHELHLHTLVLLKTGTVPRTSSGKIQRARCRQDFLAGELAQVGVSSLREPAAPAAALAVAPAGLTPVGPPAAVGEVTGWLREYAATRLNSRLMDERRAVAPHVILDFGNHGVLGLQVAPALGGIGLGHRDALRVIEQLGAIDQTLAMMTIVHNTLGIGPIRDHASPALRDALLPVLASGRELVAFAITEPGAGSNPKAIAATATPAGPDSWQLHGHKLWSGNAGWAGVINVFAHNRLADGASEGLVGFALARSTPGLTVGEEAMTLGMRAMVQNAIELDGALARRERLLGEPGEGMAVAQAAMMQGRLHIAAACVGGIKRCGQLLLRYAGRREIAGGPMLRNPVVVARLAGLSASAAILEALIDEVAGRLDERRPVPAEAYIACKTAGPEWLWQAADDLVQFLGGRGYIETNMAAQLLRDARVARILEGPTEALEMHLGSLAVNEPASLRRWLAEDLAGAAVAERLETAAERIMQTCEAGAGFADPIAARRWGFALVGRVATAAVALALAPRARVTHAEAWAAQRFDAVLADAGLQAASGAFSLDEAALRQTLDDFGADIGDVEQTLAGEDHLTDPLLRRSGPAPAPMAAPAEPGPRSPAAATPSEAEAGQAAPPPATPVAADGVAPARDAAAIEAWVLARVCEELKLPAGSIGPGQSLFDYGLDSVTAVTLAIGLEEWLGREVHPEIVYDYPRARDLASRLATRPAGSTG